jgi:Fe-S-cluster-containing dehydrogenase component
MKESRRSFLKHAGQMGLGLGLGLPLLSTASCTARRKPAGAATPGRQWGLVVDIQKCLREDVRQACIAACRRTHNIPTIPDPKRAIEWLRSVSYEAAFRDEAHPYTAASLQDQPVLVLCNHCTSPACVRVCPTQATWKRKQDGIVMMDMHRCIGCRYCLAACPYGARSFNWQDPRPFIKEIRPDYPTRTKGVVEKCNFCAERLRDGLEPACVVAAREVPGGEGALTFGDLSDPNSSVRRLLREKNTVCRSPNLGTGPNVFYIV